MNPENPGVLEGDKWRSVAQQGMKQRSNKLRNKRTADALPRQVAQKSEHLLLNEHLVGRAPVAEAPVYA
jgi:hypothetical protein